MEGGMKDGHGRGRPQGYWIGNLEKGSGKGGVKSNRVVTDGGGWRRTVYDWVQPWPSQLSSKKI